MQINFLENIAHQIRVLERLILKKMGCPGIVKELRLIKKILLENTIKKKI